MAQAPKVLTEAEMAANRAATYAEWNMDADWSEWINDQANDTECARAYDAFLNRA